MFSVHKLVRINTLALSAALFLGQPVIAKELDPAGLAFFETNIRPLLVEHCYKCHSSKAKTIQAELRVDSSSGLRRGGESGRLMVPGDVNASRIIQAIRYENVEMPPDGPLGPELIAKFERWVSIGAPYPQTGEATAGSSGHFNRSATRFHRTSLMTRLFERRLISSSWQSRPRWT